MHPDREQRAWRELIRELGRLPKGKWLAALRGGEPRNAMLLTGILTYACVMVRDLNAIAPLVTMFFLITYGMRLRANAGDVQ